MHTIIVQHRTQWIHIKRMREGIFLRKALFILLDCLAEDHDTFVLGINRRMKHIMQMYAMLTD